MFNSQFHFKPVPVSFILFFLAYFLYSSSFSVATIFLWFGISAGDGWVHRDTPFPVSQPISARLCSLCSSCLCLRIALFRPLSATWNNIPECRWPFLRTRFSSSGLQLFLRRLQPLVPNLQPFHPRLQPLNWRLHLLHQYLHPFLRLGTRLVTKLGTSWGHHRQLYRQFYRHSHWHNSVRLSPQP